MVAYTKPQYTALNLEAESRGLECTFLFLVMTEEFLFKIRIF